MNTNLIFLVIFAFVWLVSVGVIVYTIVGLFKMSKQEKEEKKYFRDKYGKF